MVSEALVIEHVKALKERYAQIGLEVNVLGPGIKEISSSINLDDGYQIQDDKKPGLTAEERAFFDEVAAPTQDAIEVFYVPSISYVSDHTVASAGYSYAPSGLPDEPEKYYNKAVTNESVLEGTPHAA